MKKIILILMSLIIFSPNCMAESQNIALLSQKGFFEKSPTYSNPYEDVKKTIWLHQSYSNTYNLEKLKELYAPNYTNTDGFCRELYFDLVKKTWANYPGIKYNLTITNIELNGDKAIVNVNETARALTDAKSVSLSEKGLLESYSNTIYYLQKNAEGWQITSDYIVSEKTYLKYGAAKTLDFEITAPNQIAADTEYTATLNLSVPKDTLIIASIGKENITYPQTIAPEVFRKYPTEGPLERILKANNQNINEYSVASIGLTKAEIKNGTEIKVYITGLGFAMTRVNVIPANRFVEVANNEKTE